MRRERADYGGELDGMVFCSKVQKYDKEWGKVTNTATLHLNVPGVVFSERVVTDTGVVNRPMVTIFPGHGSTYMFNADVNGDLKHGVKS